MTKDFTILMIYILMIMIRSSVRSQAATARSSGLGTPRKEAARSYS